MSPGVMELLKSIHSSKTFTNYQKCQKKWSDFIFKWWNLRCIFWLIISSFHFRVPPKSLGSCRSQIHSFWSFKNWSSRESFEHLDLALARVDADLVDAPVDLDDLPHKMSTDSSHHVALFSVAVEVSEALQFHLAVLDLPLSLHGGDIKHYAVRENLISITISSFSSKNENRLLADCSHETLLSRTDLSIETLSLPARHGSFSLVV